MQACRHCTQVYPSGSVPVMQYFWGKYVWHQIARVPLRLKGLFKSVHVAMQRSVPGFIYDLTRRHRRSSADQTAVCHPGRPRSPVRQILVSQEVRKGGCDRKGFPRGFRRGGVHPSLFYCIIIHKRVSLTAAPTNLLPLICTPGSRLQWVPGIGAIASSY